MAAVSLQSYARDNTPAVCGCGLKKGPYENLNIFKSA